MFRARTPVAPSSAGDPVARASPLPRSKTPDQRAPPALGRSSPLPNLPNLPHLPGQSPELPGRTSPLPNLPNLPHLPGQSPGLPGRRSPLPNLPNLPRLPGQSSGLPRSSPIPKLPLVGNPTQPGWRRRHKLDKLLGGSKRAVPVPVPIPISSPRPMGPDPVGQPTKVRKRIKGRRGARVSLFVTRVKLRLKGVKTPSVAKVAKGQVPLEAPVATPVPAAPPASPWH